MTSRDDMAGLVAELANIKLALDTIFEYPTPAENNMAALNMSQIAKKGLAHWRKASAALDSLTSRSMEAGEITVGSPLFGQATVPASVAGSSAALPPVPGEGVTDAALMAVIDAARKQHGVVIFDGHYCADVKPKPRRLEVWEIQPFILTAMRAANLPHKGDEWRDIASAPKDGTNVLLVIPSNVGWQAQSIGHWDDDKYAKRPRPYWTADIERVMGSKWMRSSQPTHWMPLPSPPALSPPVKGKE